MENKPRRKKYELAVRGAYETWGKNFPAIKIWLTHIAKKDQSAWCLWVFCKRVGKTPDELLALKNNPADKTAEALLDQFVADETIKNSVRFLISVQVKSFFKWSYKALERASGQIQLEKKHPYRKHSKEELRKIRDAARNPRDRALITFTWSSAIARESLTLIQLADLEPDWRQQEIPAISLTSDKIKGKGRGKYKGVEQRTFLTPEAKRDLIAYIDWMERMRGVTFTPEDRIFREINSPFGALTGDNLNRVALDLSRGSGVPFGWHDARRYVETALEEVKINPNWARKIRGRKVRGEEAPYSRPAVEQLRAKYKEAVSLLQFTQEEDLSEMRKRTEALEKLQVKMATGEDLDAEDKANIAKYKFRLGKKTYPVKIPDGTGAGRDDDAVATFEQVHEADLLTYLRDGWELVHRLASGEVIIKRMQ